jgi:hypothetical protein
MGIHRLPDYATRARRRFCHGHRDKTPEELVLSGKRTLEEWVEILFQERRRKERMSLNAILENEQRLESPQHHTQGELS